MINILLHVFFCIMPDILALAEGDGEALLSMWKIDMLQFWNDGYTHFFIK